MSEDKTEEIKRNILSPSAWVRILYMAFYAVACWVLLFVLPVIIICQVIISLITGVDNRNLRDFGRALSDYFHQAMNYLVYDTDDKPWPFTDGADLGDSSGSDDRNDSYDDDDEDDEEEDDADEPVRRPQAASGTAGDDVFSDISFTGDEKTGGKDSGATDGDDGRDGDRDDDWNNDKKDPA